MPTLKLLLLLLLLLNNPYDLLKMMQLSNYILSLR